MDGRKKPSPSPTTPPIPYDFIVFTRTPSKSLVECSSSVFSCIVFIRVCEHEKNLKQPMVNRVKATHQPELIMRFVLSEGNTLAQPRKKQVSVRYGFRLPKYILLRTRRDIAISFKEQNPDCSFTVSTIMREFLQNAVTPTTRDMERNTCPIHANARRLNNVINKAIKPTMKDTLPPSCRDHVCLTMCDADTILRYIPMMQVLRLFIRQLSNLISTPIMFFFFYICV